MMKLAIKAALGLGFRVFLLKPGSKKPLDKGVHNATNDWRELRGRLSEHPAANYAIATGKRSGLFVVDIDGKQGAESLANLEAQHGPLPKTVKVKTGKGFHLYFRLGSMEVRNSASKIAPGIDVRGEGGYVVGPGSVHPNGSRYRCPKGCSFDEIDIAKAPGWLRSLVKRPVATSPGGVVINLAGVERDRASAYVKVAHQRELDRLAKAPKHQRNDTLNRCAYKVGQLLPYGFLDRDLVERELAEKAKLTGLGPDEIAPTIKSGLGSGTRNPRRIPFLADGLNEPETEVAKRSITRDLAGLGETDSDNAQRLAIRFAGQIMFVNGRGWFANDEKRWRSAATHELFRHATVTARRVKNEAKYIADETAKDRRRKFSTISLSKSALERMIELAKSHLAVEPEKLDADPWLLNVENGTLDLRTGELDTHDPRDLLTQMAHVRFEPDAKAPIFKSFLKQITGGNKPLRIYLRNCVGYSLSGDTSEQVLFFCHGRSGRNGKSTLVNCIRDMLGDYGCHTPTETLLAKQYDNAISNDQARLVNKRMVTAIEANFNRQLDEAKLKAMTGGEKITARFMRQEYFEFPPEFKLWIAANDRPRVRSTDTALWRRIRVIPFNVTIPEDQLDKDLPAKLRHELPGILAWAVRGCLAWQKQGLQPPEAVKEAGNDWASEADHVKRFVNEILVPEVGQHIGGAMMYDLYTRWCHGSGEQALSMRDLKTSLTVSHNLTHKRAREGVRWQDVRVK